MGHPSERMTRCRSWSVANFIRLLSGVAAVQPLSADVEEPDGTYYEYDRNLKATVKVTPDGERTPVVQLEAQFARPPQKGSRKTAHEGMIP